MYLKPIEIKILLIISEPQLPILLFLLLLREMTLHVRQLLPYPPCQIGYTRLGPRYVRRASKRTEKQVNFNIVLQRRPVRRQGDKFDLKDNGDDKVDRTKAEVGPVNWEKLRMILTTTAGRKNTYIFKKFEGIIPDSKWKDPVFIAAVNKWKDQVLRRTKLMEKSPKGGVERRTKYTIQEHGHLRYKIKKLMEKTGTKLSGEDWKIIAKEHNERWQGQKVKRGEKLINFGKRAMNESEIVHRSIPSLKIHFKPAQIREIEAEIAAEKRGEETPAPTSGFNQEEDDEEEDDEGMPNSAPFLPLSHRSRFFFIVPHRVRYSSSVISQFVGDI
jgi:hypothetical protein